MHILSYLTEDVQLQFTKYYKLEKLYRIYIYYGIAELRDSSQGL